MDKICIPTSPSQQQLHGSHLGNIQQTFCVSVCVVCMREKENQRDRARDPGKQRQRHTETWARENQKGKRQNGETDL